jgi:hypothetical protein
MLAPKKWRGPLRRSATISSMKTPLRPANARARALLKKLQALAERGVDGERAAAVEKLARLKARFDFTATSGVDPTHFGLFAGQFTRSATARRIHQFGPHETDVANSVKWAIESGTRIVCVYRNGDLFAEANPATTRRLQEIAGQIAGSFGALLREFGGIAGVDEKDRGVFVMGLYDGMMNETRVIGQRLPTRPSAKPLRKGKKALKKAAGAAPGAGLHLHPYSLGLGLGKQIRLATPLAQITAELAAVVRQQLASSAESASKT